MIWHKIKLVNSFRIDGGGGHKVPTLGEDYWKLKVSEERDTIFCVLCKC